MQVQTLEPRPVYGIGVVARLTGVKPDTLRVWERRYGLGASHKTATGRRRYTQGDLEHLQLVSALVRSGARIGDIASSGRKTLEALLRAQGRNSKQSLPPSKPRVLVVGDRLCGWLDEHQGCIANVNAFLARVPLSELVIPLEEQEPVDMLVVDCPSLKATNVARVSELASTLRAQRVVVVYQFGNESWARELQAKGMEVTSFPPDPTFLAYEFSRGATDKALSQGEVDVGELVAVKPRQFTERELSAARNLKNMLDCECPRHIADLIRALAHFEDYSASCSVDNWRDAAVHSCVYALTGQARWLMERALQSVLTERGDEYALLLDDQQGRGPGEGSPALAEQSASDSAAARSG